MSIVLRLLLVMLFLVPAEAFAQDPGTNEVIVTGSRRNSSDFDASRPVVGLRRTADFAVLEVTVTGDTRDADKRRDEIFAMVKNAIGLAAISQVELATGDFIVEPLNLTNYRNLALKHGSRPDTDEAKILVKVKLGAGVDGAAAVARIEKFVKAVPAVGRAEMVASDDLTLSVVAPDQYRNQILDLVAANSKTTAARFGPEYAVEAKGLDRPVEWTRATLTDVFLYVPYNIVVRPK